MVCITQQWLTHWGHFTDVIFKSIFLNENVWILLKISLRFVPKVPVNNIPSLVQIMAWRRPGDKPLSEPMMVSLLMHICVTRPQRVNARSAAATLIARSMGPTWGPSGADRTQVGPMLAPWILLSGNSQDIGHFELRHQVKKGEIIYIYIFQYMLLAGKNTSFNFNLSDENTMMSEETKFLPDKMSLYFTKQNVQSVIILIYCLC